MGLRQIVACACVLLWPVMAAAAQPAPAQGRPGGIDRLVNAIERAVERGDADALRALARADVQPAVLAPAILQAVESHARDSRFTDDLTVLILKRS